MRIQFVLILGLALFPAIAPAEVSEEDRTALEAMMTDQQRMIFRRLPSAMQTQALERMRAKMGGKPRQKSSGDGGAQQVDDRLNQFPLHLQGKIRNALNARADEAEREGFAQFDESRLDESELDDGRNELENFCDNYEEEERVSMCAAYAREFASIQPTQTEPVSAGPGDKATQSDDPNATIADRYGKLLNQRQQQFSAFGMRMMWEACGCDEFELDEE